MAARVIEVCDAAAAVLVTAAGSEATVARVYVPRVNADAVTGRKVFVYPAAYASQLATRAEDDNEYRLAVQVTEKYAGDEAGPPDAWVDALVAWVEEKVFRGLGDVRTVALLDSLSPYEAEVASVFDPDLLAEHGVFESVLLFAFREDA